MNYYLDTETFTTKNPVYKTLGHVAIGLWHIKSEKNLKYSGLTAQTLYDQLLKLSTYQHINVYVVNLKFDLSYLQKILNQELIPQYGVKKSEIRKFRFSDLTTPEIGCLTLRINNNGYFINFYDIYKMSTMSVEKMGKLLNFPKFKDLDIHTLPLVDSLWKMPSEWIKRIESDVEITKRFHEEVLIPLGLNKLTISSSAMDDFKKTIGFKTYQRLYGNAIKSIEEWDYHKQGYQGGLAITNHRWQNISFRPKNGQQWDVKSAYPDIQVNRFCPQGEVLDEKPPFGLYTEQYLVRYYNIKLKKDKMAWMPETVNALGSMKYIIEKDTVTLLRWKEEHEAYKNDYYFEYEILKTTYHKLGKVSKEWFEKCFRERENADSDALNQMLKIKMNSKTGKDGQSPRTTVKQWVQKCDNRFHDRLLKIEGYHHCRVEEVKDYYNYVPLISFTTSMQRVRVMEVVNYKKNGRLVLNIDTDSLLLLNKDLFEWPPSQNGSRGTGLGQWGLEFDDVTYAKSLRAKSYRVIGINKKKGEKETKTRVSGLSQEKSKLLTNDEFKSGFVLTEDSEMKIVSKVTEWGIELVNTSFIM